MSNIFQKIGGRGAVDRGLCKGLSQDLETGWPKLAIVKFWGIQILKRYIYSDFNHKHV